MIVKSKYQLLPQMPKINNADLMLTFNAFFILKNLKLQRKYDETLDYITFEESAY